MAPCWGSVNTRRSMTPSCLRRPRGADAPPDPSAADAHLRVVVRRTPGARPAARSRVGAMTDTTLADSPARLSRADWLASLPRNTACSALVLHDAEYRLLLVRHLRGQLAVRRRGQGRPGRPVDHRRPRGPRGNRLRTGGPAPAAGVRLGDLRGQRSRPSSTSSAPPSWNRSGWTASASRRSTTTGSCSRSRNGPGTSARTAPGGSARSATRCAPAVPSACATATR